MKDLLKFLRKLGKFFFSRSNKLSKQNEKSNKGAVAVEYVVILATLVIGCWNYLGDIENKVRNKLADVANSLIGYEDDESNWGDSSSSTPPDGWNSSNADDDTGGGGSGGNSDTNNEGCQEGLKELCENDRKYLDSTTCECVECLRDSQCNDGKVCVSGECKTCTSNTQCPDGQKCESGVCITDSGEPGDSCEGVVCDESRCQICVSGECVESCANGQNCDNGECINITGCPNSCVPCQNGICLPPLPPGFICSEVMCGEGFVCVNNQCVPGTSCANTEQCNEGQVCKNGICITDNCKSGASCPSNQVCEDGICQSSEICWDMGMVFNNVSKKCEKCSPHGAMGGCKGGVCVNGSCYSCSDPEVDASGIQVFPDGACGIPSQELCESRWLTFDEVNQTCIACSPAGKRGNCGKGRLCAYKSDQIGRCYTCDEIELMDPNRVVSDFNLSQKDALNECRKVKTKEECWQDGKQGLNEKTDSCGPCSEEGFFCQDGTRCETLFEKCYKTPETCFDEGGQGVDLSTGDCAPCGAAHIECKDGTRCIGGVCVIDRTKEECFENGGLGLNALIGECGPCDSDFICKNGTHCDAGICVNNKTSEECFDNDGQGLNNLTWECGPCDADFICKNGTRCSTDGKCRKECSSVSDCGTDFCIWMNGSHVCVNSEECFDLGGLIVNVANGTSYCASNCTSDKGTVNDFVWGDQGTCPNGASCQYERNGSGVCRSEEMCNAKGNFQWVEGKCQITHNGSGSGCWPGLVVHGSDCVAGDDLNCPSDMHFSKKWQQCMYGGIINDSPYFGVIAGPCITDDGELGSGDHTIMDPTGHCVVINNTEDCKMHFASSLNCQTENIIYYSVENTNITTTKKAGFCVCDRKVTSTSDGQCNVASKVGTQGDCNAGFWCDSNGKCRSPKECLSLGGNRLWDEKTNTCIGESMFHDIGKVCADGKHWLNNECFDTENGSSAGCPNGHIVIGNGCLPAGPKLCVSGFISEFQECAKLDTSDISGVYYGVVGGICLNAEGKVHNSGVRVMTPNNGCQMIKGDEDCRKYFSSWDCNPVTIRFSEEDPLVCVCDRASNPEYSCDSTTETGLKGNCPHGWWCNDEGQCQPSNECITEKKNRWWDEKRSRCVGDGMYHGLSD